MHSEATFSEFLRMLAKYGTVDAACSKVGISRDTAYRKRKTDEDFAQRWELAKTGFQGWTQVEMVDAALGEGRWAGKGPALQPLIKLHQSFNPELYSDRSPAPTFQQITVNVPRPAFDTLLPPRAMDVPHRALPTGTALPESAS